MLACCVHWLVVSCLFVYTLRMIKADAVSACVYQSSFGRCVVIDIIGGEGVSFIQASLLAIHFAKRFMVICGIP